MGWQLLMYLVTHHYMFLLFNDVGKGVVTVHIEKLNDVAVLLNSN